MRIGVNLCPLVPGRAGGVRQHVSGLLDTLRENCDSDQYVYYGNSHLKASLPTKNDRIRFVDVAGKPGEIMRRGLHGEFDVLYAPLMDLGIETAAFPAVSLLVDLQHHTYPEFFSAQELRSRRLLWEWSARASQFVCASTEYVANTIVNGLGIDRSRIVLTPPLLSQAFLCASDPSTENAFFQTWGGRLPSRYLFYPANTWAHKNHLRLLAALSQIRKHGEDLSLVLSGWPSGAEREIHKAIRRLGLKNYVTWLGYLPDEWMPLVYRNAEALVFPSLYEGFGIPLIEAMGSGCPIACSNTTSCPEVAADAALYFDPESVDDIAAKIREVTTSRRLRDDLIEAGRNRAARFASKDPVGDLRQAFQRALEHYEDPLRWSWPGMLGYSRSNGENGHTELPLVSVVVPSFQQGHFIRRTLDSVLGQGYPNIEVLVVDGGSTDGTVEILRSYGDRIRWVSEPDRGQADALNKGLKKARGSIIGWLNSDDIYLPQAIEKAVYALGRRSGCLLIYGEAIYIDEEDNETGHYSTDSYSIKNLLRHCCICQPAVFFSRKLFEIAGGVNESLDMAMDYELWLRYSKVTHFLYVPEELAASRMYSENKTSLRRLDSIRESMRACRDHYGRSSVAWCRQFAHAHVERVSFIRVRRWLRLSAYLSLLAASLVRDQGLYVVRSILRDVRRSMK